MHSIDILKPGQNINTKKQFLKTYSNSQSFMKFESNCRPYEWTFVPPSQVPINYQEIHRLSRNVIETLNLLTAERLQNDEETRDTSLLEVDDTIIKAKQQTIHRINEQRLWKSISVKPDKIKDLSPVKDQKLLEQSKMDAFISKWVNDKSEIRIEEQEEEDYKDVQQPDIWLGQVHYRWENKTLFRLSKVLLQNQRITFNDFEMRIDIIKSIKIYAQYAFGLTYQLRITFGQDNIFLGVHLQKKLDNLPEHYIWFSKIITSKLIQMGVCIDEAKSLIGVGEHDSGHDGTIIHGQVYKRSKYRKLWNIRHVVITNEGLFSYKNINQNYSFFVDSSEIEQLWTNFEFHNSCLIIKIKHSNKITQFAIPVADFSIRKISNWLFAFYRLLMEHQVHITRC